MITSQSLELAKSFLGKPVKLTIDRPLGSLHPKWNFQYEVNYGYVEGTKCPDGEELDGYLLNVDTPVKTFEGIVISIVHRIKDDDDKLVVVPVGTKLSQEEIEKLVAFQEQWFEHTIIN